MKFKKGLSLVLCIITALVVLICVLISNGTFSSGESGDDSIAINSYDVDIDVSQDNVCHVEETISVTFPSLFYGEKHGIYRHIPYEIDASFVENDKIITRKYGADIANIFVDKNFEVSDEDNCAVIRIGSEYSTVNGQTITYNISYDYKIRYDRDETKDFLYFNLIGTEWNNVIYNVTFSVTMPSAFDSSNAYVYYGAYGSDTQLTPSISGNTISGSIDYLTRNEGVTLKVNLPNDYFTVAKINYGLDWLLALLSVVMLFAVLGLVAKSKGEHVVETVEVLPPSNLTPSDCGFYLNGTIRNKDITSLIIYWANNGYLFIDANDGETKLTKIKEMTNEKDYEMQLFNKMFKDSNVLIVENNIDLFANESSSVITKIKKSCGGAQRIDKQSNKSILLALILTIIPVIIFAINYWVRINLPSNAIGSIICIAIVFLLTTSSMMFTFSDLSCGVKEWGGKLFSFINLSLLVFLIIRLFNDRTVDKFGIVIFVSLICVFGIYLSCNLIYYKKDVNAKLGKILGFKNFLIGAERQRMEVLLKDNPNYFYDVLSYAYVMDIEDEFIKKFDGLLISPPDWYGSNQHFNSFVMFHTLNNNFKAINRSITTVNMNKNSGSSGGFGGGGGGFSGGGFGGGGGGSW